MMFGGDPYSSTNVHHPPLQQYPTSTQLQLLRITQQLRDDHESGSEEYEWSRQSDRSHLMNQWNRTSKEKGFYNHTENNYEATYCMKNYAWFMTGFLLQNILIRTIFLIIVGSLICDIQWMECVAKAVTPQLPLDQPQGATRTCRGCHAFKGRTTGVVTLSCKEDIVQSSGNSYLMSHKD